MAYKSKLAVLGLTLAILSAPLLSPLLAQSAFAHEGCNKSSAALYCQHMHMSKDKEDLLRATFKKLHEDNKPLYDDMHKLRQQQRDILAAKTFDKSTYMSLSEQIEEKHTQIAKSRDEAFASIADKFAPQEREHVSKMLNHHHGHWPHHGHWGHGKTQIMDHQDGMKDNTQMPSDHSQDGTSPVAQ